MRGEVWLWCWWDIFLGCVHADGVVVVNVVDEGAVVVDATFDIEFVRTVVDWLVGSPSTGLRRRLCWPRRDSVGYSHLIRRRAH